MRACHNRLAAVNHELQYVDRERNREYRIAPGELPFFMHRERGLHLDEPEVTVDGQPVSAAILGTALTLYYPGRAQAGRGQGIYFYLPKVDGAEECAWYRDVFDRSRALLPFLQGRDDPRDPPRGVAARGLRDGGDAPRARARTRPGSTRPAGTSRRASSSS